MENRGSDYIKAQLASIHDTPTYWYTIDVSMLSSKVSYFFNCARRSCYSPYTVSFMMSIGLDPAEAGLVNGLSVVGLIVGGPIWGLIADHKQIHGLIMFILCIISMVTVCVQPFISIPLGDKTKNVCPLSNTSYSVTNEKVSNFRHEKLLYIMVAISILAASYDSCTTAFIDAGVTSKIGSSRVKRDFGYQRLFGSVGIGCGALLSSAAIYIFPSANVTCYAAVFGVYFVCSVGLAISTLILFRGLTFHKTVREDRFSMRKQLWKTLPQGHVYVFFFFFTVTIFGIEVYLNMYFTFALLKERNSPNVLLGLSVFISAIACVIIFAYSSSLIEFFGVVWRAMVLCLFSYTVRYIATAYLKNPWLILIVQPLHGIGFALFLTAAVKFINDISHPSIIATMYSIKNVLLFGISETITGIAGRRLYKLYGVKYLFLGGAILAAVWAVIVILFLYFCENNVDQNKFKQMGHESEEIFNRNIETATNESYRSAYETIVRDYKRLCHEI